MGYSTTAGLPALGTTVPTGGEQMYSQLTQYPNQQSEIAAYAETPTQTPTQAYNQPAAQVQNGYTDADVYAAFGTDPETLLRAAGIGRDGLAGLAMLGISPAQFIGQAFGL